MDKNDSYQDVVRCPHCQIAAHHMYCDSCHLYICKSCVDNHLSDSSKEHKLVPYERKRLRSKCEKHYNMQCDYRCEKCNTSLCELCISSEEHKHHNIIANDWIISLKREEDVMQTNVHESEENLERIYEKPEKDKHRKTIKIVIVTLIVFCLILISFLVLWFFTDLPEWSRY